MDRARMEERTREWLRGWPWFAGRDSTVTMPGRAERAGIKGVVAVSTRLDRGSVCVWQYFTFGVN